MRYGPGCARWTMLAVFLGAASACGGSSETPIISGWSSRGALPVPRADHALVSLGGQLYAIGGYSGSTLARVDRYDPASNTWTRRSDMQSARREFAAGALNGKIYVACGMSWSNPNAVTYVTSTEEYDPAADTWTTRAPCPMDPAVNSVYPNVNIAGAVANGRLYVIVFNVATAGFYLTWEPFDWGRRRNNVAEKSKTVEQARNGLRETESQIAVEIGAKYRKWQEAALLLKATRTGHQAATEQFRTTSNRYKEQAALLRDVLQAQARSTETEFQYQHALSSYWSALADLRRAMGDE